MADLYYIDDGYFDPSLGYYVYTADAASAMSSQATVTATCGVVKATTVAMTATSSVSATISHIEGADMFAFANAQLAAQVNLIRDNNIAVTSAFTQVTAGSKFIQFGSDYFSDTSLAADNLRVRYSEAAANAAFSLTAELEKLAGAPVEASGAWTSAFTIDCKGSKKQNIIDCGVTSAFTQTTNGSRIRFFTGDPFHAEAFVAADADLIAFGSADIASQADLTAACGIIKQGASDEFALFEPSITCVATRNSFAVLDSVASLSAAGKRTRDLDASLNSQAAVSASASRTRALNAALTSAASLALAPSRIKSAASDMSSAASVTTSAEVVKVASAALASVATVSATATKTQGSIVTLNAAFSLSANNTRTRPAQSAMSSAFIQTSDLSIYYVQVQWQNTSFGFVTSPSTNGSSLYLPINGTANTYIEGVSALDKTQLNPGANDFTYEFCLKLSNSNLSNGQQVLIARAPGIEFYITRDSTLGYYHCITKVTNTSGTVYTFGSNLYTDRDIGLTVSGSIPYNFAFVRSGNTFSVYWGFANTSPNLSLTRIYTGTISGALSTNTNYFQFIQNYSFNVYIDEVRFTAGARYSGTTASYSMPHVRNRATRFLAHLDGNYVLETSGLQLGQAALTSTATVSAQPSKFVEASAALSAQGFEVIAAGGIRPSGAGLDSAFTISITPTWLKRPNIALASTASVSATAIKLKIAQAALTSTATVSANPIATKRLTQALPSVASVNANITAYQARATYLSDQLKSLVHFDSPSITDVYNSNATFILRKESYVGTVGTITTYVPTFITGKFNQTFNTPTIDYGVAIQETTQIDLSYADYFIETWYKHGGDVSNYPKGPDQCILRLNDGGDGIRLYVYDSNFHTGSLDWGLASNQVYFNYSPYTITPPPSNKVTNFTAQQNVWNHYLVSRNIGANTWTLYINGQQAATWTSYPVENSQNAIWYISDFSGTYGYWDELRLEKDKKVTANFTPATTPYPSEFQYLVTAYGLWNSTSSAYALPQYIKRASADLTSQFTQSATNLRVRYSGSTQQSTASVNAQATKVVNSSAQFSSQATMSVSAVKVARTGSSFNATATQTISAIKAIVASADMPSTSSLVATPKRTRGLISNQQSQFTQVSNVAKKIFVVSNMQAFAAELSVVNKIGRGFIHMDSVATVNAIGKVTTDTPIHLASTASVHATGYNTQFGTANLNAQASLVLNPTYLRRNESLMQVTASLTANNVRTRRLASAMQSQAALAANTTNSRIRSTRSQMQSQITLTSANQILRLASADLFVEAAIPFALGGVMVRFEADLQCEGFILSSGEILHIDPYYQIKIRSESRYLKILQESRLLLVEQETRVNKIIG